MKNFDQLTKEELEPMFLNHKCIGDNCQICIRWMELTNPQRLIDLGINEDPAVNDINAS